MFTVPAVTPVTSPVAGLTVARAGFAELHTPPDTIADNVVTALGHTSAVPMIIDPASGKGLTVTTA